MTRMEQAEHRCSVVDLWSAVAMEELFSNAALDSWVMLGSGICLRSWKGVKSRETKIYFYKFDVLWKHIGTFRTQNLLHKDCSAREPRSGICAV